MLRLWKNAPEPLSREELFAEKYDRLLQWALRLTSNDRAEAEDLLHDAFVDFSIGQTDLSQIENIDGYLRTVLRNIHLSRVRKASRHPTQALTLIDYDSLSIGLRTVEPHLRLQLQDELRSICEYACLRRQTSKAGSALILRFFHDYYPSEVALVMGTTGRAVSEWLRIARTEAKTYLESPAALNFMCKQSAPSSKLQIDFGETSDDISPALRQALFRLSHEGVCLSCQQLADLYRTDRPIDCETLAQIVTCLACLDLSNAIHGLPSLAERYSLSPRDREPPNDGDGGQAGGGASPARLGERIRNFEQRAKEVFEHRPEELHISANGLFLVSQKINASRAEQTLSVNIDEEIGFIEILSEQDLRLLLLNVEPPPAGPGEQSKIIDLSDGRSLTATLRFSGAQPMLHVVYHDPSYGADTTAPTETLEESAESNERISSQVSRGNESHKDRLKRWLRGTVFDATFWLRPGVITSLVAALILMVALVFMHRSVAPVTANDLLRRAAAAEALALAGTDQVIHRTLNFEIADIRDRERKVMVRQRVEIWEGAEKGITVRRLYDEHNRLVAGAWTRDGVTTIYHHGAKLQLPPSAAQLGFTSLGSSDMWLALPSANNFLASASSENLTVEQTTDGYVVTYLKGTPLANGADLVRATLTLNAGDLHVSEMTLVISANNEQAAPEKGTIANQRAASGDRKLFECRFSALSIERHPANTISPTVFELEPELLSDTKKRELGDTGNDDLAASPHVPIIASADLEVELMRLLDQVGAFQGDQLSVTRTAAGTLLVQAVLDSPQRKAEILNSLRPLLNNPAVHLEIDTIAEATERRSRARPSVSERLSASVSSEIVEVEKAALPVDAELRHYFRSHGVSDDHLEAEMQRYATRVIDRSLQALLHGRALKQLANQFSPNALQSLDTAARAKWKGMLIEHARAFVRETSALRHELEPIFYSNAVSSESNLELQIGSDIDIVSAATRLFEQASAHERAVSRAFSTSAGGTKVSSPIKSDQFRRSLRSAEALADRIARRL